MRRTLTVIALATAVAVLVLAGRTVFDVFLLGFAGTLLAIFLHSISAWVAGRTGLSYGVSLTLVVLLLIGALAGLSFLRAGQLIEQSGQVTEALTRQWEQTRAWLEGQAWGRWVVAQAGDGGDVVTRVTPVVFDSARFVVYMAVILAVGLYVAAQPDRYARGLLLLVPPDARDRGHAIAVRIHRLLQWWLIGRVVSMVIVGVLTMVGLLIIGVPLAFFLGLLAAILTFIPNIGPVLSVVPAVALAAPDGLGQIVAVLILYAGIQTVESYAITPIIEQRAVSLPPGIIVLAQVGFGLAAGWLGLVVATPLTAVGLVLVKELYVKESPAVARPAAGSAA